MDFHIYETAPERIEAIEVTKNNLDELLDWGQKYFSQYGWDGFNCGDESYLRFDFDNGYGNSNFAFVGDWLAVDHKTHSLGIVRKRDQYQYRRVS